MLKKLIVPALLILGLGIWWTFKPKHVEGGKNLTLHGNVDIREVTLGFRVAGRIASVLRDEGDEVKTGEILAKLDDEPYQRAKAELAAQVATARAKVQLLESGYRPQEVAQARASAREREVTFDNAKRLYDRQQQLLDTKAVSVQERDDAEARFREAEARLKSAQEQLTLLESGYRSEEIAQARGDLARAEAALSAADLNMSDAVLRSPSDGIVLTRAQEPGAIVAAGTAVLTVSLQKPVWVRVYIHETEVGLVPPGKQVLVYTDSRPDKPYRGTVGYVSPRAEFTPKNVETDQLRTSLVYRARITIVDADDGLRQGMPVTVRFANE
jgi:HlyD family secretion protein